MTTYTEAEFGTRILRDLGLVGAEETPSAADLNWAVETARSEIATMGAIGLQIWNGSSVAVPDEYFSTLSRRVGLAVAPAFGLVDPATAQAAMRAAEVTLTLMAAPQNSPTPLKTDMPVRGGFNFTTGR